MQNGTHINPHEAPFPELDALRGQLGLPQAYVCRRAEIDPSTYVRWRRWARGERGGHCPKPGRLKSLRVVLAEELLARTGDSAA
jgi:transposase-like protein